MHLANKGNERNSELRFCYLFMKREGIEFQKSHSISRDLSEEIYSAAQKKSQNPETMEMLECLVLGVS